MKVKEESEKVGLKLNIQTSPYEFLGREERAGSQGCSPALSWESRSRGQPPPPAFRKGASSPGVLPLSEQGNASCQRVKGHEGLSRLGRCSAWRCRTRTCHRAALCRLCFGSSGQKPEVLNPQAGGFFCSETPRLSGLCRP